jgi:hypothetical protein
MYSIKNSGQWTESTNPLILSVIHHRQNPFDHFCCLSEPDVEALQVELLKILLDNCDGTPTQESSRKIFLRNFRKFLLEDVLSDRVSC